jgi:hypothetical protein
MASRVQDGTRSEPPRALGHPPARCRRVLRRHRTERSVAQINFSFTAPLKVMLSRVDPTSKQEILVGTYFFVVVTEFASPGTEWRFALVDEKMGYTRRGLTYVTTDAPLQHVEVTSVATGEGKVVDKVVVHGVTNPPVIEIPVTPPPSVTPAPVVTVTVTPGVSITGNPSNVPISLVPYPRVALLLLVLRTRYLTPKVSIRT